jgi:hypothetical protein
MVQNTEARLTQGRSHAAFVDQVEKVTNEMSQEAGQYGPRSLFYSASAALAEI